MRATDSQRRELGAFIRARRERLTPDMFGIAPGLRRRTPGLKREEVAQLAGVSATWFSWIEQGREISVSPAALARLARVLRLAPAERAYLFDLTGKPDPDAPTETGLSNGPAGLTATVDAIAAPAYILDRTWTALAWNRAAADLFVGWLDADADRNLLRYVFLSPAAPGLIADWPMRARRLAAEFRADYSHHLAAAEIVELVADLSRRSAVFAAAWDARAVIGREGGERTFTHPSRGFLRFEQVTLLFASHPDTKLVMLTPG